MYTVSTKSKQRYPAISSASGIPLLCVGDVEYMIIGVCVVAIVMANKPSSSSSSSLCLLTNLASIHDSNVNCRTRCFVTYGDIGQLTQTSAVRTGYLPKSNWRRSSLQTGRPRPSWILQQIVDSTVHQSASRLNGPRLVLG